MISQLCLTMHRRYVGSVRRVGLNGETLETIAAQAADWPSPLAQLEHVAENCGLLQTDGEEPECVRLGEHPDFAAAVAVIRRERGVCNGC